MRLITRCFTTLTRLPKLLALSQLIPVLVLVASCKGPPPTQYVIITSTPTPEPLVITVVVTAQPEISPTATPTVSAVTPEVTPTLQAESQEATAEAAMLMPTPTFRQIYVAEQPFENGRMFWLEPIDQIWVLIQNENDKQTGVWLVFPDDFEEGDIEFDPKLVAPEGLFQPERGFGKLWRENTNIHDGLGWAKQAEIGFVTNYEYYPAGSIVNGQYVAEPGYHLVSSGFSARQYRFNEINGTWQVIHQSS